MEDILGLAGVAGFDSAIEYNQNQITFENFIVQASNANVLASRTPNKRVPVEYYNLLYDCLVDIGAIKKKWKLSSFMTGSSEYTVSKNMDIIQRLGPLLVNKKSKDFIELTKHCIININALIRFLQTYKYSPNDQFTIVSRAFNQRGGKRRHKSTRRRYKTGRRHILK